MAKITRLGDPDNPYTRKKVTAAEAAQSKKLSDMTTPKRPKPAARAPAPKPGLLDRAKKAGSDQIKDLNNRYGGGARKRAIDDAIEGRSPRKRS